MVDEVVGAYLDFHECVDTPELREVSGAIYYHQYQDLVAQFMPLIPDWAVICLNHLLNGRRLTRPDEAFAPIKPDICKVGYWTPAECAMLRTLWPTLASAIGDAHFTESTQWAYETITDALDESQPQETLLIMAA